MRFNQERKNLIKEFYLLKKRGETRNFLPKTEDGKVHIPLKGDADALFSPFNPNTPSSEAIEYLREASKALLANQKAEIVLDSACDLQVTEERFKNFFAYSINKTEREKRHFARLSIIFLILGTIVILASFFFAKFDRALIAETIDTVGGFLIWTSAEFWFIESREYNKFQLDDLRLYATPWTKKA